MNAGSLAALLAAKRDGLSLDAAALRRLMTADGADDAQLGAFAMAVALHGMSADECAALTAAMRDSGCVLDWNGVGLHGPCVDKHSTGGVGDLVSLVLAPALAACGAHVPMLSGRALGHSGGTLDKLESIPGYDVQPSTPRFQRVVAEVGCAIIGATGSLAPADRRLYGIRDRTATVDVLPLIVASILSKKLAVGLDALVLDVKCGNGALLADPQQSRRLAALLAETAATLGLRCAVRLSDMQQPLADCAGNALEIREALACLRGERPHSRAVELTLTLGADALQLAGLCSDASDARRRLQATLDDGRAAERFAAMVHALGGPADLLEQPDRHLPMAPIVRPLPATRSGYLAAIDVATLGRTVIDLGGGRRDHCQAIDHAVGLAGLPRLGQALQAGQPLAMIHARDEAGWQRAAARLGEALRLTDRPCEPPPLLCAAAAGATPAAVRSRLSGAALAGLPVALMLGVGAIR